MVVNIKHIILFAMLSASSLLNAQIFTIDTTGSLNDPVFLIPNYLAGNGVTISNPTWYGSPCQFGKFTNGLNYMGIDSGIIMTTGRVMAVTQQSDFTSPWNNITIPSWMTPGPNGYFTVPNSLVNNSINDFVRMANYNYALLSSSYNPFNQILAQIDTIYNRVAIMEFDIVPLSDTINLELVFASEHWGGFYLGPIGGGPILNSAHDPVLILASGPNISGSFSSTATSLSGAKNYLWLPNRSPQLAITTCTLHGATWIPNIGYSANSHNTNVPVYNSPPPTNYPFNFNGYSDILQSNIPTIPCETYHIKILIAKNIPSVTPTGVDSGVMLKAKSLSSEPKLDLVVESDYTLGFDTALVEGCGQTTVYFIRNSNVALSDTIHFNILGTATNGVDYTFLPDSIVFAAGDDSFALTFTIPNDALTEGIESLIFDVIDSSFYLPCGTVNSNLLHLTISDQSPLITQVNDIVINCTSPAAVLGVSVSSGLPNFLYVWGNGDTLSSTLIQPIPTSDTLIFVTITDGCNNQKIDSALIDVQNLPLIVNPLPGTVNCKNDSTQIGVNVISGYPPYTYTWFNGSTDTVTTVGIPFDTSYYSVTVTDACNRDTVLNVPAYVFPYTPLSIAPLAIDSFWCVPHIIKISSPTITGGSGNTIMSFNNWADSINWFFATTSVDTTVVLQVIDLCVLDTVTVNYVFEFLPSGPFNVQLPRDTTICQGDSVKLVAMATGGYPPYKYVWDNGKNVDYRWVNIAGTQHYSVSVTDGCGDRIVKPLTVHAKYITAAFSSSTPEPLTVQLENQSSGANYYLWHFGDGDSSSTENPTHQYQIWDDYIIKLYVEDTLGCFDSTETFITLPLNIYVPNAFTPNNDEHNNVFEIKGIWNDNSLQSFSVDVYDRWGGVVYSSHDIYFKWDGTSNSKPVNSGAYAYVVKVKFVNHDLQTLTGSVNVIR